MKGVVYCAGVSVAQLVRAARHFAGFNPTWDSIQLGAKYACYFLQCHDQDGCYSTSRFIWVNPGRLVWNEYGTRQFKPDTQIVSTSTLTILKWTQPFLSLILVKLLQVSACSYVDTELTLVIWNIFHSASMAGWSESSFSVDHLVRPPAQFAGVMSSIPSWNKMSFLF